MNDAKFIKMATAVVALLNRFRNIDDKAEKRIIRDLVRAMVKELTKV